MRPHVTKAFTVLGLALVAWGIVALVSRSAALKAARQTIADQKEENAAKVEAVYRLSRELIRAESLKVEQVRRDLYRERAKSMHVLVSSQHTIDSLRLAFGDTGRPDLSGAAPSDSIPRSAFTNAVRSYDTLAQQFRDYLMSDSTYHLAEAEERKGLYRSLTLADSTIAAKNEALKALRKVSECTIVWRLKCPTRTQTFVLGAIATGAVVVALR